MFEIEKYIGNRCFIRQISLVDKEGKSLQLFRLIDVVEEEMLLRILTANEGVLSDKNREALSIRYHNEWELEKRFISQQMKEQTDYLDRYVEWH